MLHAEVDDVYHTFPVPIIERSANVRRLKEPRHKVIGLVFLNGVCVVCYFILVIDMRNLAKTLVPNKNGKSPLPADPTLILWLC
jgi:hypothetical protein